MWHSIHTRTALTLALALFSGGVSRGDDAAPAAPEPAADRGFPWLCFSTTILIVGGLYIFVRRREQAAEAERKQNGTTATPWYCRACARDVIGPECPRCRTANPFLHDSAESDSGQRPIRKHG